MRLLGKKGAPKPEGVWIVLTRQEAWDLKVAFDYFFDDPSGPGWHHHVGDGIDEITIEIEIDPAESELAY
jgi:hypothetical protein